MPAMGIIPAFDILEEYPLGFLLTPPHSDAIALLLSLGFANTWYGDLPPQVVPHAKHTRLAINCDRRLVQ